MNLGNQDWQTIIVPPERLLWNGQPTIEHIVYRSFLIMFVAGLFAGYIAYRFLASESVVEACGPHLLGKCETIYYLRWLFFGVPVWGIALCVGEYLGQVSGLYARDYAITSERAILRYSGLGRSIKSVKLEPNMTFREQFGALSFGDQKRPALVFSCLSDTDRSAAADTCKRAIHS